MKRCPECRRDYYDDTLLFCLDDGNALLEGPASMDEPQTIILDETAPPPEAATRGQIHTTEQTAVIPSEVDDVASRKNFDKRLFLAPLALAVIAFSGFFAYLYLAPTRQIDSIAVLPFENAGGSADSEYLSDGISEALINSLTELQQLKVIARGTAFRYKGKEIDPKTVGRELNVGAVLMGRVRQVGDLLNVQVDLVDTANGAQLWGKEYERRASDVLSVKQAIAREVTENLKLRLSGEQQQQLTKHDTTNAEAYQFYLRGRYYWNKRTADGLRSAINEFQKAVDRDPNYALGYVGLSDSYLLLEDYAGAPTSEIVPQAKAAAERALQIDDSLAEAHTSLAKVYTKDQWRWAEAEQEFRRAIALNPNYPTAHHWYSSAYLRPRGQLDDALREGKRAQELDPLSQVISNHVVSIYLQKNDLSSAMEQAQTLIELDPSFPNSHMNLGWIFFKQRRYDEALAEFQKSVELSGSASNYLCNVGYIYAMLGKRGEALSILRELEDRHGRHEALGMHVAGVYVGLGEKDQVFAWLEKDFEQRSGLLPDITSWHNFDDIRSDPLYTDLLKRMGMTE